MIERVFEDGYWWVVFNNWENAEFLDYFEGIPWYVRR